MILPMHHKNEEPNIIYRIFLSIALVQDNKPFTVGMLCIKDQSSCVSEINC